MILASFSHAYGQCAYHIVFVPKYRRKIFVGRVATRLEEIFRKICEQNNVVIHALKVMADHVHLFASLPPSLALSRLFHLLKGVSSRVLFQENPQLKSVLWGGHLWSRGKFFRSVGSVKADVIERYIKNQSDYL